jgi:hypothetical protein
MLYLFILFDDKGEGQIMRMATIKTESDMRATNDIL